MLSSQLPEQWTDSEVSSHLYSRHVTKLPWVSEGVAVWLLWSPRLTGYLQYRPNGDKKAHTKATAKYYMRGSGPFGWDTLDRPGPVFLVEGLFDAVRLHSLGLPALAVLSNSPTPSFAGQLFALGRRYVALCDGDSSGLKLAKFAHEFTQCPEGHDVASVDPEWLNKTLDFYT